MTRLKLIYFLLIVSPFWLLFFAFLSFDLNNISPFFTKQTFSIFLNTVSQSLVSALVSTVLGIFFSFGLLSSKNFKLKEFLILLPNFLPVLMTIFSILYLIGEFPYGFWGIVFTHTFLNAGLASVVISAAARSTLGHQLVLSELAGMSKTKTIFKVLLPGLSSSVFDVFLLIFAICMTSFAVPLVIGGGKWPMVETAIYEFVKIDGNYPMAVSLSLAQSIFVVVLGFTQMRKSKAVGITRNIESYQSQVAFGFALVIPVGLLSVFFWDLVGGWAEFLHLVTKHSNTFVDAFIGSLLVSFLTGFITILLFVSLLYLGCGRVFDLIYRGLVSPSTALVGASFIFMMYRFGELLPGLNYFLTALGLSLMSFGFFYRMKWSATLKRMESQRHMGLLSGASHFQVFLRVLLPQVREELGLISAISAFWGAGDFALSKMLLPQESTLGLVAQSLLSRYKFDGSSWVIFMSLAVGLVMYFLFRKISYVTR